MATKLIRVNVNTLLTIKEKVGDSGSWTSKINKLLTSKESNHIEIDYNKIKKLVEEALFEFKSGRI